MRRLAAPLALLALFAAGHGRFLGVGHLAEDWAVLGYLERHGNGAHWTGPWLGLEHALVTHRPVATGLYAAELEFFGTDPLPAHAHHLLWHLAAVLLVHVVLRSLGARGGAALAGAALFAVHPYLPGATGWLAGRASVAAGVFTLATLAAWLRFRAEGRGAWYATALVAAPLAALSRENGYLAFLVPATCDVILDGGRVGVRGLVRRQIAFAVSGSACLALRWASLGALVGGYAAPEGPLGAASWSETLRTFGGALLRLLGGLPPELLPGGWILPGAGGALVVLLLVRWASCPSGGPRRGATGLLLALFAEQALLLLLTGPTLLASTGQRWYTAIALACALVGLAAGAAPGRRWALATGLLLVLYGAGHLAVQEEVLRADRTARSLVAETERFMEGLPGDTEALFLTEVPATRQGLPVAQWGLSDALKPPFRPHAPRVPLYPVHPFMKLGAAWPAWSHHPPVELMLRARGRRCAVASCALGPGGEVRLVGAGVLDGLSPERLRAELDRLLPPRRLEVLRPQASPVELSGRPLRIPVALRPAGCRRIEFFLFHPSVDMRHPVPVPEGRELLEYDLGPVAGDFVLFHEEPAPLYVVPVGWSAGVPRLGPALEYRIRTGKAGG